METNKSTAKEGWVEVLFRDDPNKEFNTLADVKPEDYHLTGNSPIPIKELVRPYDVYVMLHEKRLIGLSRDVRHGDILNVCITSPVRAIRTYVLLDSDKVKATLTGGVTYRLDIEPGYPLGALALTQKFPSFWTDKHTHEPS